ncbi:RelA/SpoT family protein [Porphyromonas pogonae]|uniref:RelA/SpoT family protein n=1 Tax=Porphyromonas pogonae TaxID=867595 RepID=UPI002E75A642|nr:HD domain-containing protein [Porphyromonas pogonae]
MFTEREKYKVFGCVKELLPTLKEVVVQDRLRSIRETMLGLIEAKCFDRDDNGFNGFVRQMEVARIAVKEMGLDADSVLAVLFYRPVYKEFMTLSEVEALAGENAVRLIQLLIKTSELYMRAKSVNSENFHNLLLSIAEDMRVVLLIIADRLYLLRNAKQLHTDELRTSLAVEVSFLYAPIAHRLGLYTIKGEMEDLCLKYTDRKTFDYIKRKLGETKNSREAYIKSFITPVRARINKDMPHVNFEIKGRTKSISSIRNKLKKQSFEDIYDLFAIRIILDVPLNEERHHCWHVYSIITDMFMPNPERLKDWISIPKSNGYESLHITVMGPQNKWVEVQIRTRRMDEIAEMGLAAHWKYKGIKSETGLDEFLTSVRETLEEVRHNAPGDKGSILESSLLTLKTQEIYVFTPQGAVIKLPSGATVLDFAFTIHSRVGAQAVSAKVNGKNVSIKQQLHNGDSVEVITNAQQTPKADWLNIVVSTKARSKIRQILRAEEEAGISVAKELINRRIKNRKLQYNEALFLRLTKKLGYKTLSEFYNDISHDKLDVQLFMEQYEVELKKEAEYRESQAAASAHRSADTFVDVVTEPNDSDSSKSSASDILVLDQGLTGVEYSLAQCCHPIYGDQVFGFVSNKGIKIHRTDCPNAPDMFSRFGNRIIQARWSGKGNEGYRVSLEIVGRDDLAVVTNITSLLKKENNTKLRGFSIDSADSLFKGIFTVEVNGREALSNIIRKLRSVVGVKSVERL